jgi:hypothetical protein
MTKQDRAISRDESDQTPVKSLVRPIHQMTEQGDNRRFTHIGDAIFVAENAEDAKLLKDLMTRTRTIIIINSMPTPTVIPFSENPADGQKFERTEFRMNIYPNPHEN